MELVSYPAELQCPVYSSNEGEPILLLTDPDLPEHHASIYKCNCGQYIDMKQ